MRGLQRRALSGFAASAELADQHQVLEAAVGLMQLHQSVATIHAHEAEFPAEHRAGRHLERALAERAAGKEHHLAPEAAVVLLHIGDGLGGLALGPKAPQPEPHQAPLIAGLQAENRWCAVQHGTGGIEGRKRTAPLTEVAQEVLPLAGHARLQ